MTFELVMTMISTVAFPIAMCILEAWFIKYIMDKHGAETKGFQEALENNTNVISILNERLRMEVKQDGD